MTKLETPMPKVLFRDSIVPSVALARACGVAAFSLTRRVSDYQGIPRAEVVADLKTKKLIPENSQPRFAHQVHSCKLDIGQPLHHRAGDWWESSECDGLTSDCDGTPAGQPLVVLTADCCPVVLAGRISDSSVWCSALHAGWRGALDGIVLRGIEAARQSGVAFSDLHLWIGPHISLPCYEVGEDLIERFQTRYGCLGTFCDGRNLDLAKLISLQAQSVGVKSGHISIADLCTFSNPHLFPSFRRDGRCNGQILTVVYPIPT